MRNWINLFENEQPSDEIGYFMVETPVGSPIVIQKFVAKNVTKGDGDYGWKGVIPIQKGKKFKDVDAFFSPLRLEQPVSVEMLASGHIYSIVYFRNNATERHQELTQALTKFLQEHIDAIKTSMSSL